MNYNYEISVQKKKNDINKYSSINNENDSQTFIFELILRDKFNNFKVFRRIKKCNQGNLISSKDNISYNIINKYKLTVIDINKPDKPIIIKETINSSLVTNTFINSDIYLEVVQDADNIMEFNYHIIN